MKTFIKSVVALIVLGMAVVGCAEDVEYTQTYGAWGVTTVEGNGVLDYYFLTDDSTKLIPIDAEDLYEAEDDDRVYVTFSTEDDQLGQDEMEISVISVSVLQTKDLLTVYGEPSDTLGSASVQVSDGAVWQSNNLLNMIYTIDVSGNKVHSLNLVYFPDSSIVVDGRVYLELRHNDNDDIASYQYNGYIGFDMESIAPFQNIGINDSVPYTLIINSTGWSDAVSRFEGYFYSPDKW